MLRENHQQWVYDNAGAMARKCKGLHRPYQHRWTLDLQEYWQPLRVVGGTRWEGGGKDQIAEVDLPSRHRKWWEVKV